jgi:DnaK suppressor protein
MNETRWESYAATLAGKEAELAGRLGHREGIAIDKSADPLDEIQSATERDLAVVVLHRESTLLRKVRRALARIGAGTYGVCLHCEAAMNAKRLAAVPWADYCIACQEAADRYEFDTTGDDLLADAA